MGENWLTLDFPKNCANGAIWRVIYYRILQTSRTFHTKGKQYHTRNKIAWLHSLYLTLLQKNYSIYCTDPIFWSSIKIWNLFDDVTKKCSGFKVFSVRLVWFHVFIPPQKMVFNKEDAIGPFWLETSPHRILYVLKPILDFGTATWMLSKAICEMLLAFTDWQTTVSIQKLKKIRSDRKSEVVPDLPQ